MIKNKLGTTIYEKGDIVELARNRSVTERRVRLVPDMERHFGKIVTISAARHTDTCKPAYTVRENRWSWDNSLIAGLAICTDEGSDLEDPCFSGFFDTFKVVSE